MLLKSPPTCLSLQCMAQVKLCVRFPDITFTNWGEDVQWLRQIIHKLHNLDHFNPYFLKWAKLQGPVHFSSAPSCFIKYFYKTGPVCLAQNCLRPPPHFHQSIKLSWNQKLTSQDNLVNLASTIFMCTTQSSEIGRFCNLFGFYTTFDFEIKH